MGVMLATSVAVPPVQAHVASASLTDSLRIRVAGEVPPSCSLTQPTRQASFNILDDMSGGTRDAAVELPFAIDCNASFNMTLRSRNGSLDFEGISGGDAVFRRTIDYRAEVQLPGDAGGVMRCASASMTRRSGCAVPVAADDVVQGSGHIRVLVSKDGRPLLRGVYSDTLTLTLQPRLGGDERD